MIPPNRRVNKRRPLRSPGHLLRRHPHRLILRNRIPRNPQRRFLIPPKQPNRTINIQRNTMTPRTRSMQRNDLDITQRTQDVRFKKVRTPEKVDSD